MTPNFTLDELTFSDTAVRLGIDNSPSPEILKNLLTLANGLEDIRTLLGDKPLRISSGYRCKILNNVIGGSRTSAHMEGFAADFTCREYGSPLKIVQALARMALSCDQLIQEGTWVHVSFDPRRRGEVLTAHFGQNGTTYTKGA